MLEIIKVTKEDHVCTHCQPNPKCGPSVDVPCGPRRHGSSNEYLAKKPDAYDHCGPVGNCSPSSGCSPMSKS